LKTAVRLKVSTMSLENMYNAPAKHMNGTLLLKNKTIAIVVMTIPE